MGQIIHLEQIKIEREGKIRSIAIRQFPWTEIKHLNQYLIDPMVDQWVEQKRIIVKEAVFRLVYEAFISGVMERKNRQGNKQRQSQQWSGYGRSEQKVQDVVQHVMDAFAMFRVFDHRQCTSLHILFGTIAEEWYLRGISSNLIVD